VYLFGYYAGEYANIWCEAGSTCTVECVGMGCWKTIIYYWSGADVIIEPTECKYGTVEEVTDDGVACPSIVLVSSVNATVETDVQLRQRQKERRRSTEYEQLTARITAKNEALAQVMVELEETELERSNLEKSLFSEGALRFSESSKDSGAMSNVLAHVEAMPVSATLSIGALVGTVCSLAASACWNKARADKVKYQPLQ